MNGTEGGKEETESVTHKLHLSEDDKLRVEGGFEDGNEGGREEESEDRKERESFDGGDVGGENLLGRSWWSDQPNEANSVVVVVVVVHFSPHSLALCCLISLMNSINVSIESSNFLLPSQLLCCYVVRKFKLNLIKNETHKHTHTRVHSLAHCVVL